MEWIANKCASIGRIDSIQEFYQLYNGDLEEDSQSVVLTYTTIGDINQKIIQFKDSILGATRPYIGDQTDEIFNENCSLEVSEVKRSMFLNIIISFMEQPSRLYMLYYLLRVSVRERDFQDFEIITEFLAYLTESRRFTDAFMAMLDEMTHFGPFKGSEDDAESDEVHSILEILNMPVFTQDLSKLKKLHF